MSLASKDTSARSKPGPSASVVFHTHVHLTPTSTEYQEQVDTAIVVQGNKFSDATQTSFAKRASSSIHPLQISNREICDSAASSEKHTGDFRADPAAPEPEEQQCLPTASSTTGLALVKYRSDIDSDPSPHPDIGRIFESSEQQAVSGDSTRRPSEPVQFDTCSEVCRPRDAISMPSQDLILDDFASESSRAISVRDATQDRYLPIHDRNFYVSGKVLHVPPNSRYAVLANRAFIVLAVSDDGWVQCLCICHHKDYLQEQLKRAFFQAHAVVHSTQTPPNAHEKAIHPPIRVHMDNSENKLEPNCFVNFEHTWTLRTDTEVASIGMVVGRSELLHAYQKEHNRIINKAIQEVEDGD